jgi:hypothetical protein
MDARQIERYLGFLGQKLDEMQTRATIPDEYLLFGV